MNEQHKTGITAFVHPGSFDDGELNDLQFIAELTGRKSARFAEALDGWVVAERERRAADGDGELIEPQMLTANYATWSNSELGDAMTAAHIAEIVSYDSSPRVRHFLQRVAMIVISWGVMRLNKGDRR